MTTIQFDAQQLDHLWAVLSYLHESEARDYEERGLNNVDRDGHVFESVLAIEDILKQRHPDQYDAFVRRDHERFEAYLKSIGVSRAA